MSLLDIYSLFFDNDVFFSPFKRELLNIKKPWCVCDIYFQVIRKSLKWHIYSMPKPLLCHLGPLGNCFPFGLHPTSTLSFLNKVQPWGIIKNMLELLEPLFPWPCPSHQLKLLASCINLPLVKFVTNRPIFFDGVSTIHKFGSLLSLFQG